MKMSVFGRAGAQFSALRRRFEPRRLVVADGDHRRHARGYGQWRRPSLAEYRSALSACDVRRGRARVPAGRCRRPTCRVSQAELGALGRELHQHGFIKMQTRCGCRYRAGLAGKYV